MSTYSIKIGGVDFQISALLPQGSAPFADNDVDGRAWIAVHPAGWRPANDDGTLEYVDGPTGILSPRNGSVAVASGADPNAPLTDEAIAAGRKVAQYIHSAAARQQSGHIQAHLNSPLESEATEYDAQQSPVVWLSMPLGDRAAGDIQKQLKVMTHSLLESLSKNPSLLDQPLASHASAVRQKAADPFATGLFDQAYALVSQHAPELESSAVGALVDGIMKLVQAHGQERGGRA